MSPLINPDGSISVIEINKFSYTELRNWLVEVLRGQFPPLRGGMDEYPHMFLLRVYQKLDPSVREAFRDILMEQLSDLAQNHRSRWKSESGDELLLLITDVFPHADRSGDPISQLFNIVTQRYDLKKMKTNLHLRAAQALVGLKFRPNPEFWIEAYSKGGSQYAPIVFAGLTLSNISFAFEWLTTKDLPSGVFSSLLARLPWLIQVYGTDNVTRGLEHILRYIPPAYDEQFRTLTQELGISFLSGVLKEFSTDELRDLAGQLGISIDNVGDIRDDIAWTIEKKLLSSSNSFQIYDHPNHEVRIISCISEYVAAHPLMLDIDFRWRFYEYGKKLQDTLKNKTESRQFLFELEQIREKATEVEKRIVAIINLSPDL